MEKQSRRRFLKQTPVLVAVAGTASLVASCSNTSMANEQDNKTTSLSDVKLNGPVIAQITDVAKGEIILMVNSQDIIIHDTEIVQRLLKTLR